MPLREYLEAGQIVGTHGVRGEMRVQPWCDSPEVFARLRTLYMDDAGKQPAKVRSRAHKQMALMLMDGIDTVEAAAALRGRVLWLHRRDLKLPADTHFVQDLIGCHVTDADTGEDYGVLTDVSNTGANDIYHLDHHGREVLIPAIPDIVVKVDPKQDLVVIHPMKGLFDDAD